jgi:hypothetical protein
MKCRSRVYALPQGEAGWSKLKPGPGITASSNVRKIIYVIGVGLQSSSYTNPRTTAVGRFLRPAWRVSASDFGEIKRFNYLISLGFLV